MRDAHALRETVREKYGALAAGEGNQDAQSCCSPSATAAGESSASGCGCGCGGGSLLELGYTAQQAQAVPAGADLGLGCGNPVGHAALEPGEVVLDLGSGAGVDAFIAAREVGPTGRAIGVDMTPAMLARARANAERAGATNVEFRLGEIEHLPLADASVDAVISNCVINLSPEKDRVFGEAYRVLRPGGRLVVGDLVLTRPLPDRLRESIDSYVGCIAGASLRQDYLALIRAAGFADVEVVEERRYQAGADAVAGLEVEREAYDAVVSLVVRAIKHPS
jgi:SAM-dependent methyltransferase